VQIYDLSSDATPLPAIVQNRISTGRYCVADGRDNVGPSFQHNIVIESTQRVQTSAKADLKFEKKTFWSILNSENGVSLLMKFNQREDYFLTLEIKNVLDIDPDRAQNLIVSCLEDCPSHRFHENLFTTF